MEHLFSRFVVASDADGVIMKLFCVYCKTEKNESRCKCCLEPGFSLKEKGNVRRNPMPLDFNWKYENKLKNRSPLEEPRNTDT